MQKIIFGTPKSRGLLLGSAILALISLTVSTPALADPRWDRGRGHGHDRGWHRHEVYAHHYWHGPHYVEEPSVVYAPPVIYEPPPIEESPGINLVFPIHIH